MVRKIVLSIEKFLQNRDFDGIAAMGDRLGMLMWRFLPKRRRMATAAIKKHLEVSEQEASRIARESFRHNARSFLELTLVPAMDERFLSDRLIIDDPEHWKAVLAEKTPAVITTAHLGAWELLAGLFGLFFPPDYPRLIIVRRNKNPLLNERIFALRGAKGATILSHRNVSAAILTALKSGGVASFLVDHNCNRRDALFLPFLQDIAAVNMGPALLTVRSRVPTFSIFLVREGEKYRMLTEPWLRPADLSGSIHERVEQVAKNYTASVEKYVRRYPEQWFWMHNRWKTRPEDPEVTASHADCH